MTNVSKYANILLLFDGSTIDYINNIKNNADMNLSNTKTVIVKTKNGSGLNALAYYQG